ncbi:ATP-binding domain-containing protein [Saccharophagus degradans]|uniref:DNA 3'-5' helicase II n=1 Tax=Saccharophagus degradans TaxID=86304 RepID=A0AAW7X9L1_9GAMM|nr:ATP-binding domain-containing protein [Saccharophagus degradans]MDO6423064.1 ATP-binding domain-containing protein [Saccharophagus degradans]MDO6607412.1 ATP-binding domain-containing protein [Saccharophagus degradans]
MGNEISDEYLQSLSAETLDTFEIIEAIARDAAVNTPTDSPLANTQTFTGSAAQNNLNKSNKSLREGYRHLQNEPAIARIHYSDEEGIKHYLYISRTISLIQGNLKLVSQRAPIGRLVSLDVGDSEVIDLPGESKELTLIEVCLLEPIHPENQWDSLDTTYKHESGVVKTIKSLRQLLAAGDEFEAFLQGGQTENATADGILHKIRTAMELRDQPILDKFQDEIYRLPLSSQLFIAGPPGTGKTTTLIKRLGQKLDVEFLSPMEKQQIEKTASDIPYTQNWLMFTPTELLKHYLQEAYNREQVPASDQHIRTWEKTRLDLARNVLGLLQTGVTKGKFIFKKHAHFLARTIEHNPGSWFEAFERFASEHFFQYQKAALSQLTTALAELEEPEPKLAWLPELQELFVDASPNLSNLVNKLELQGDNLQAAIEHYNSLADKKASTEVKGLFQLDKNIFEELSQLLEQIALEKLEQDDEDLEEDEQERTAKKMTPQEAAKQLIQIFKSIGRARYLGRSIGKNTRNGRVLIFLGDKAPISEIFREMGRYSTIVIGLRSLSRLPTNFLSSVPNSYKRFRRENVSYYSQKPDGQEISATELDAVILLTLSRCHQLLAIGIIQRSLSSSRFSSLATIASNLKAQVLVDEATDFSILQLASMQLLADPATRSFFACGDFNQRLTVEGVKAITEFEFLPFAMSVWPITTVYRQSQRLNILARELLVLNGGDTRFAGELSKDYIHPGVAPVLIENLQGESNVASWLALRIEEIEDSVKTLPTIGVLVNHEEEVEPLANALKEALEPLNIVAEACSGGKSLGEASDVRVFSAQYIKGLEFEAVFLVGIDRLEEQEPDLFDKYLYVGVTRAATYLGLTCYESFPTRLNTIKDFFEDNFEQ